MRESIIHIRRSFTHFVLLLLLPVNLGFTICDSPRCSVTKCIIHLGGMFSFLVLLVFLLLALLLAFLLFLFLCFNFIFLLFLFLVLFSLLSIDCLGDYYSIPLFCLFVIFSDFLGLFCSFILNRH